MSQEMNGRGASATSGVGVKSNLKAGGFKLNHNQTVKGLRVKSKVRAGGITRNHNQSVK